MLARFVITCCHLGFIPGMSLRGCMPLKKKKNKELEPFPFKKSQERCEEVLASQGTDCFSYDYFQLINTYNVWIGLFICMHCT